MMCPFFHQRGKCRAVHLGLEKHTGPGGVATTEEEYGAIKNQCITTFAWQDADTPPFPGSRNDNRYFGEKGHGKGKGKGKVKGKGKGKGS